MRAQARQALRCTGLQLEQWRNFSSVNVALPRRVFLIGPNASGKSNFLDVFRFLRDIAALGGGFGEAVRKRGGVSSLRSLAARRYPDILVCVQIGTDEEPDRWTYELVFYQDNLQRPVIRRERVTKRGQEILRRPNPDDERDPARLTQTYLEQVSTNQDFREIAGFLTSVRYLHIVPQLVREPDRSVGRQNDPYGGDFLEQVASKPQRTREAWLRRIGEALQIAVPQLGKLELWRDVRGTPHLRGNYVHWRPQGAWQNEDSFSDGTLRLLGLLWAVLEGDGPLLLEEPELSLHPEIVRHVPQLLARMQRRTGRQVILSTHSGDLLGDEGIGLDEVLLLWPEAEGSVVKAARDLDEVPELLRDGLSLPEVVLSRTRPARAGQLPLALGD
jgi:hypothetical protein